MKEKETKKISILVLEVTRDLTVMVEVAALPKKGNKGEKELDTIGPLNTDLTSEIKNIFKSEPPKGVEKFNQTMDDIEEAFDFKKDTSYRENFEILKETQQETQQETQIKKEKN